MVEGGEFEVRGIRLDLVKIGLLFLNRLVFRGNSPKNKSASVW